MRDKFWQWLEVTLFHAWAWAKEKRDRDIRFNLVSENPEARVYYRSKDGMYVWDGKSDEIKKIWEVNHD